MSLVSSTDFRVHRRGISARRLFHSGETVSGENKAAATGGTTVFSNFLIQFVQLQSKPVPNPFY